MREILFRAKRIDNGEWVEGYLMDEDYINVPFNDYDVNGRFDEPIEIAPETVCQYTGLTDRNGKKIFEGDIFQAYDGECLQKYAVIWNGDSLEWTADCVGDLVGMLSLAEFGAEEIDVIGNIFDDPELLGEKAGRESRAGNAEPAREREDR